MHKDLYNINVAFCCSENLVKSLEEVKPFLGFNLNTLNIVNGKKSNIAETVKDESAQQLYRPPKKNRKKTITKKSEKI